MSQLSTDYHTTDPLQALGPSVLLQVFHNLPLQDLCHCSLVSPAWKLLIDQYSTSIFRGLAERIGISEKRLKGLKSIETGSLISACFDLCHADPRILSRDGGFRIDWRGVCEDTIVTRKNWRSGRARNGWLTPDRNTIWRIKVDPEEQVLYSVSRVDGIQSSSANPAADQSLLFEYIDAAPYSHMEFTSGYIIFNVGLINSYEVHLTPPAVQRLTPNQRRALPLADESEMYGSGYSHTLGIRWERKASSNDVPPRGHLTYYKTIRPPTDCWAFRARVDRECQEEERPVVGLAGEQAIYIYGLADGGLESIPIRSPLLRSGINYIEFDDDHVFICGRHSVHIYSRKTKQLVLTLPSVSPVDATVNIHTAYCSSFPKEPINVILPTFEGAARVAKVNLKGSCSSKEHFRSQQMTLSRSVLSDRRGFTACHYTSSDLFCAHHGGTLWVLRDYKLVLALESEEKRQTALSKNLLPIMFGSSINQLYTNEERVVFNTNSQLFILDTSALPRPPYDMPFTSSSSDSYPPIPLLSLLDVHPKGLKQSSCLQMDGAKIYLVYWALGENDAGGVVDENGEAHLPPEETIVEFAWLIAQD
ncbi:hypothetical protein L204_102371 [Cryptococcus depauperatus]